MVVIRSPSNDMQPESNVDEGNCSLVFHPPTFCSSESKRNIFRFNMLGCDRSFAIPSYVLRVVVTPKEGETNHLEECRLQIDTRPAQQTTKIPKVSARFKQLLLGISFDGLELL